MNFKDLTEFVSNPNFIPGIYNYCDRWCERCPFSARCSVYAIDSERPDDPETRDINNEKFWNHLSSIFRQTKELILSLAEENGVDLDSLPDIKDVNDRQRKDARAHPLCAAGEAYAFSVSRWFDNVFTELETSADGVEGQAEATAENESLADALEVVRWYQFFIAVKTMRGVLSRAREQDDEVYQTFPKDSDGSIKVALIAIDRSISAWRLVQLIRYELSDSIVPFLLQLERLRLDTETEFPLARDFIRAGFDEQIMTIN